MGAVCKRPPPSVRWFIRCEIDPFQRTDFAIYAANWGRIILRCGGCLIDYQTDIPMTPKTFDGYLDGLTLDYVYEFVDDNLIIWFRHKGSDNRMKGSFAPDGDTFAGAWAWPGGGYSFTWTRVKD